MKKRNTIVTLLMTLTMLTACSSSSSEASASVSDMAKSITECGVSFNELAQVPDDKIPTIYGLSEDDYSEASAYIAGSGGYADEVAIFKASSSDKVSTIEDALNNRLESRKNDFEDYVAEQYDILCDSEVITTGNYVCLIVCVDNDTAEDVYNSYF
ncbi:MAG: DUF4358 domain-containing protein [Ruminococcus sp.]|nr:DUF4358 domain-containing protein [Ruminococcus sp.]